MAQPKNVFLPVPVKGGQAAPTGTPAYIKGSAGLGLPLWMTGAAPKSPTVSQYLARQDALKAQPTKSFFGRVESAGGGLLNDIGHPVSWTFDKLLRPMYAVEGGIDSGIKGQSIGHGALQGLEGHTHTTGSQILSDLGLLHGHGILRGIAGLGIDVATDPLTYLTGGTSVLESGAEHAALLDASKVALNTDAIDHASADALNGLLTAKKQLLAGGKDYRLRAATAGVKADVMKQVLENGPTSVDKEALTQLGAISQTASKEFYKTEKFLPHFSAKIPFGPKVRLTPTEIAGKRVVPALPKLANVAEKGGVVGKAAKIWQNHFITPEGFSPAVHSLNVNHAHIVDLQAKTMSKEIAPYFKDVPKSIIDHPDRQLGILHHFEKPGKIPSVVELADGTHILNPTFIKKGIEAGKFTAAEAHFANAYHEAAQHLFNTDKEFHVSYENMAKQGRIYVPRIAELRHTVADMPTFAQKNAESLAGFQRKQTTSNMSLYMIKKQQEAGKIGDHLNIEYDPMKAIFSRVMEGAGKQADQTMVDALTKHLGIATRTVSAAKLAKNHEAQQAIRDQIDYHEAQQMAHLSAAHDVEKNATQYAKDIHPAVDQRSLERLAQERQRHIDLSAERETDKVKLGKELDKLQIGERKILKGTKNRAFNENLHSVTRSLDEHGHPIALPKDIATAVTRYTRLIGGNDQASENLIKGARSAVNYWKGLVTSVNPGYRFRYSLANFVAMWTKGMPAHAIPQYMVKAGQLLSKAKAGDPVAMATMRRIESAGGTFGLFRGDVAAGARLVKYGSGITHERPDRAAMAIAQKFNIYVDNLDHVSFLLWNKDKGMSWEEAIRQTKETLFDYTDLTPFERRTMKTVAPFYSWLRKNIPFQLKQFAEHPGRETLFPKVAQESEGAQQDKGNILPDYIANTLYFGVPFGQHNYYRTSAGVGDLRAFESKQGAEELGLGALNPAFKIPAELISNRSFFTGQAISDPTTHAYAPATPLGADVAKLLSPLFGSPGTTSRMGRNAQPVSGPGINPKLAYLFQQVPWANSLLVRGPGSLKNKTGVPWWTSQITGASVSHIDPATQRAIAEINQANKVKAEIAKARDLGQLPRAKKPKTGATGNITNQLLFRNMSTTR